MATDKQGGLAVKIVVGLTSVIGIGIMVYKQVGPALSDVELDRPGPIIAGLGLVLAVAGLIGWRWITHRRDLGSRIRRRG